MRPINGRFRPGLWALTVFLLAATFASATTFKRQATVVDLIGQSEFILRGNVTNVTDGFDSRGIPYTEVTIRVTDPIKGSVGSTYTFRQFGLLKPRSVNGRTCLMVTPAAFATYRKGEDTVLFLYKQASRTGLRTTTGLGQGKFNIGMTGATNQFNNAGLFNNVQVDSTLLNTTDQRVMTTTDGAMNTQGFIALVKKAVNGKWVEKGKMKNAKK